MRNLSKKSTALGRLNPTQIQALEMMLEGENIKTVAKAVGMHYETVRSWVTDHKDFSIAYRDARRIAVTHAVSMLQMAATRAARQLIAMLDEEKPSKTRMDVCEAILTRAMKGVELETLAERIEILERMMTDESKYSGATPLLP